MIRKTSDLLKMNKQGIKLLPHQDLMELSIYTIIFKYLKCQKKNDYDYMIQKCGKENVQFNFMDTASFMVLIKAGGFYKDIVEDIEEKHDPSNHNEERRKRS